jgi:hypothetical protein
MVRSSLKEGVVSFWTLSASFDRQSLLEGWGALGHADLVPEPRPYVAVLKDALAEVVGTAHTLIRPLASKTGFTVVRENRGEDENEFVPLFNARIPEGEGSPLFNNESDVTDKVLAAFFQKRGQLTAQQVSGAMVAAVYKLGGIRLRPTGGIYWLAGSRMDEWEQAGGVVAAAARGGAATTYVIRHEIDEKAALAVQDALVEEVEAEAKRLVQEVQSGELGGRAVRTRKAEAVALRNKVTEYEQLLNTHLGSLRSSLDAAEQSIAMAALLTMADLSGFRQEVASVAD